MIEIEEKILRYVILEQIFVIKKKVFLSGIL